MLFESKVTPAFVDKVKTISANLGINPDWLMLAMFHESGLNPKAYNSVVNGGGLIGFLPSTATAFGTTIEHILSLDGVGQLDYVYQVFKPYAGKITSYPDLHLIAFFPAALGKPDSYVLQTSTISAQLIRSQNAPFDTQGNNDGVITAGEARAYFERYADKIIAAQIAAGALPKSYRLGGSSGFVWKWYYWPILALVVGLIGYFSYKKFVKK